MSQVQRNQKEAYIQDRTTAVFDPEDALSLFKVEPNHPINSLLTLTNDYDDKLLIYVGAFFQFTQTDRDAWNSMIIDNVLPDPSRCLGAQWCRRTDHLEEEDYRDHMPVAKYKVFDEHLRQQFKSQLTYNPNDLD